MEIEAYSWCFLTDLIHVFNKPENVSLFSQFACPKMSPKVGPTSACQGSSYHPGPQSDHAPTTHVLSSYTFHCSHTFMSAQQNFWKTVLFSHQKFRSPRGQVCARSPVENKLGWHSPQPDPVCPSRELEGKADQLPFQTHTTLPSFWTNYCNRVSVFHIVRQQGLISLLILSSHRITPMRWYTSPGRHLHPYVTKDHHGGGWWGMWVSMCLHNLLP